MFAFLANSSSDSCANTRATIPCTQRSRFLAMSRTDSRSPRCVSVWSRNIAVPPRLAMPTSKVTRVRSEGFSKISARNLAGRARAVAVRAGLDLRGEAEEIAQLRGIPFRSGEQIVSTDASGVVTAAFMFYLAAARASGCVCAVRLRSCSSRFCRGFLRRAQAPFRTSSRNSATSRCE